MKFDEIRNAIYDKDSSAPTGKFLDVCPEPERNISLHDYIENEKLFNEDYIYFGQLGQLCAPAGKTNMILYGKITDKEKPFLSDDLNLLLFEDFVDYKRARKCAIELFDIRDRLYLIGEHFLDMVQSKAKPQRMLDYAQGLFGNPLLLFDASLSLMNSSGTKNVSDEPVIEYALKHGNMPDNYINEVLREENDSTDDDKVLIVWEKSFLNHRLLAGRVVFGDTLIGYVKLFEYNKPLRPYFDAEMMRLTCRYMAISLQGQVGINFGSPQIESFLQSIIEKRLTEEEQILNRVEAYRLEFRSRFVCIVVRTDVDSVNTDKIYIIKKKLRNFLNRKTILILGNEIVAVYDKDSSEEFFTKKSLDHVAYFMEENNCRAAYSPPFRHIKNLPKYYNCARACFSVSDKLQTKERIMIYENYKIHDMLLSFADKLDLNNLIHSSVKRLMESDSEKGGELTPTMFEYLRNNQDVAMTAKKLNLHYNSLKYRIARVREIAKVDFSDPETVFKILLSEKVLQLRMMIAE